MKKSEGEEMADSQIDPPVLVTTVIATGLALLLSPAAFGWLTTIGGVTLLLILFAYDGQRSRSILQSLAFSAVCGLAFTLASGIGLVHLVERASLETSLAVVWLCATVIATAIDRARVDNGIAVPVRRESVSRETAYREPDIREAPARIPVVREAPSRPSAPASGFGLGLNTYAPIDQVSTPVPVAPPAPRPAYTPVVEVAAPVEMPAEPVYFEESAEGSAASPAAIPQPVGIVPTPGLEETVIYVDVVGQGISFLRSVRAEHIARDIYRIIDEMPADENWRYQPGQTVRCKKRKLSSGKALVAFEEIVLQQVS